MNKTIKNLLNKGVPVDTQITVSMELMKEFCKDKEKFQKSINEVIMKCQQKLQHIEELIAEYDVTTTKIAINESE